MLVFVDGVGFVGEPREQIPLVFVGYEGYSGHESEETDGFHPFYASGVAYHASPAKRLAHSLEASVSEVAVKILPRGMFGLVLGRSYHVSVGVTSQPIRGQVLSHPSGLTYRPDLVLVGGRWFQGRLR